MRPSLANRWKRCFINPLSVTGGPVTPNTQYRYLDPSTTNKISIVIIVFGLKSHQKVDQYKTDEFTVSLKKKYK